MTAPTSPTPFAPAGTFPPADRDQWRELVATTLRRTGRLGPDEPAARVEELLSSTTDEGIVIRPLHTAADAPPGGRPVVPGLVPGALLDNGLDPGLDSGSDPVAGPAGWDVRQPHRDPDPVAAAAAVLTDLENGATSLWLTVGSGAIGPAALEQVLADVDLALAPVVLSAGADTEAVATSYLALLARRALPPGAARGNLGADPIGDRARSGRRGAGVDLDPVARLAQRCLDEAPGLRAVTVDATVHHDAGGGDAQELGLATATAVAYLRALTGAGLSLEQAFGQLEFRLAAGADQFATIAKFRAGRLLWARVAQVCGLGPPAPGGAARQLQHAVTSAVMTTRRDPWVNLLRGTVAAFGAGVGGADAVTVLPFDAAIGAPDGFARRLARNTSAVLTMESHAARVVDPAGGSWYVERLTADLAAAGWAFFTEIEAAGGVLTALDDGLVADRLAATWHRRADDVAHRRAPITGVSEFPDLAEAPVTRDPHPEPSPVGPGALPVRRYAAGFEALRDAADAATAATGTRPAVFLATIGPVAAHTARAGFAAALFAAGGLATPDSGAGTDPVTIARAFTASGARVACLASSDRLYAEHAATVAKALRAAGAQWVWLAGRPGEQAADRVDGVDGVDDYVFTGVDALAVLADAHRMLEIGR